MSIDGQYMAIVLMLSYTFADGLYSGYYDQ